MSQIIRRPEVERRTGKSKAAIYAQMKAGAFPRAVKIGSRAVGWIEEEIDRYVEAKIAVRDRNVEEAR
jgi:prophage regulatory protein